MTSTSQRTPARHAEPSQSGRPRSTSSTNSKSSAGRLRRNVSFSSGELTVIVHTVFLSAWASATNAVARTAATSADLIGTGIDLQRESSERASIACRTDAWRYFLQQRLNAANQDVDRVIAVRRPAPMLPQRLHEIGAGDRLIIRTKEDAGDRRLDVRRRRSREQPCQRLEALTVGEALTRQRLKRVCLRLDVGHLNDVLGDRAKLRRIVDWMVAKINARDLH